MKNIIIATFLYFLSSGINAQNGGDIRWYTFSEAWGLKDSTSKPILIIGYTSWDKWSVKFVMETFRDQNLLEYLNKNYLIVPFNLNTPYTISGAGSEFISVNTKKEKGWCYSKLALALLDVEKQDSLTFPFTIYFNEKGERVITSPGYKKPNEIIMESEFVLSRAYQTYTFVDYKEEKWSKIKETKEIKAGIVSSYHLPIDIHYQKGVKCPNCPDCISFQVDDDLSNLAAMLAAGYILYEGGKYLLKESGIGSGGSQFDDGYSSGSDYNGSGSTKKTETQKAVDCFTNATDTKTTHPYCNKYFTVYKLKCGNGDEKRYFHVQKEIDCGALGLGGSKGYYIPGSISNSYLGSDFEKAMKKLCDCE